MDEVVPSDSRYIPFTQQPACCVPTCIQMVMYKQEIPLVPADEIGYHLGLVVHPDRSSLFYNVRTSDTPPRAGYGTQIYLPEYEPNVAFKKLAIPLSLTTQLVSGFENIEEFKLELQEIEKADGDALLCFNYGALHHDTENDWGHVVVFDRIVDDRLRIIDPAPNSAKWQLILPEEMFAAMKVHGDERSGGIWKLTEIT